MKSDVIEHIAGTDVIYSEGCSSLSTELLSSVNKNWIIVFICLILQLKDENEASYFCVQGAR